ncbi:MAG: hypothetical protein JRM99_01395 [Nitrososphaerota archaeon]|nr:hypothetical protein [Nitrososphaerota archaeon]
MPGGPFITFALNFCSGFVALLTSYYAYKSNRLVRSSILGAIGVGFMLLGVGLVVDAGTSLVSGKLLVEFPAERILTLLASFTYLAIQMVAYLVVAMGYAKAAYGKQVATVPVVLAGAAALGLYRFSLLSYFVAMILLAFIVFQGLLIRSGGKSRYSAMVLLGFGLILAAHAILLFSVLALWPGLFVVGTGVQFFGFLSLMAFVVRSEVVGSG